MIRSFYTLCWITPLLLLIPSCKKDKPNIEITYCNGGMVPDTITFSETNVDGADYIWQLFAANGTALSDPTPTGAVNAIFERFDSAGTYKVRVDVNNKCSAEVDFTLRNFVSEGSERAVSFFDNSFTLWTVYPDSDCRAAVRVKQVNGIGGIDYFESENKLFYVAGNDMTFCFPNGEELTTLTASQGFVDISIEQSTGKVFLGTFGGLILQTTISNLSNAVLNNQFDEQYELNQSVEELTFNPQLNTFFFTDGSPFINSHEAIQGATTGRDSLGSSLFKTAIAFDVRNRRLYFAEGNSPCFIVAINPDQPNQRVFTRQVPCDGSIQGMDIDEAELDIVYTDGENVWLISVDNESAPIALIADLSRTIRIKDLNFAQAVDPPIGDVVIARYND